MPRACLFMIRTALLWMLGGYTVAGLLMLNKALGFFEPLWSLRASHIYMLLVGWLVQLSAGVMIWVMPRLASTGERGDMRPVWFTYLALNAGVALAAAGPPLQRLAPQAALTWMAPLAGGLILAAVSAFLSHIWRRVRPIVELAPAGIAEGHEVQP